MFSPKTTNAGSNELIPDKTLAQVLLTPKEFKNSKETQGRYLNIELTVASGAHEKRKMFFMLADPWDQRNSQKWRDMAIATITRILETIGVFKPAEPSTYSAMDDASLEDIANAIDGKIAGVLIGIEKSDDGHEPKNKVKEWASTNPDSGGYKIYTAISEGKETLGPVKAEPISAFSQPAKKPVAPVASPSPTWLKR